MTQLGENPQPKTFPWSNVCLAAGTVANCLIIFLAAHYHLIQIPFMKLDITVLDSDLAALKQHVAPVRAIEHELDAYNQRAVTLSNLVRSRVRYGPILSRLRKAITAQEGVRLLSLRFEPDNSPPPPDAPIIPNSKRYVMTVGCAALGANAVERDAKLAALLNLLEKHYAVGCPYNPSLGVVFSKPVLLQRTPTAAALECALRFPFALDQQQLWVPAVSLNAAELYGRAQKRFELADSDGAIADLEQVARLGPQNEAAWKAEAQLLAIHHPLQPVECEFQEAQGKVTHWIRPDLGRFEESLPNGVVLEFTVVNRFSGRFGAEEWNGTVVLDSRRNIEVLLPDKEGSSAKPSWRYPGEQWKILGEMRNAK